MIKLVLISLLMAGCSVVDDLAKSSDHKGGTNSSEINNEAGAKSDPIPPVTECNSEHTSAHGDCVIEPTAMNLPVTGKMTGIVRSTASLSCMPFVIDIGKGKFLKPTRGLNGVNAPAADILQEGNVISFAYTIYEGDYDIEPCRDLAGSHISISEIRFIEKSEVPVDCLALRKEFSTFMAEKQVQAIMIEYNGQACETGDRCQLYVPAHDRCHAISASARNQIGDFDKKTFETYQKHLTKIRDKCELTQCD